MVDKKEIMLKNWKNHLLPADILAKALVGLIIRTKLPVTESMLIVPNIKKYQCFNKSPKSCFVNSYEDNITDYVSEFHENGCHKNGECIIFFYCL